MANARIALVSPVASGASNVAHYLSTSNAFTAGDLFRVLNQGTEKLALDYDGNLEVQGELRDKFNVKTYGAVGDGVTDDTAVIAAAIAAMSAGDVLYFPPGTYVTSSALSLADNNVALVFAAGAKIESSSATNVLNATSLSGITIQGGHFDGGDTGSHALLFTSCIDVTISGAEVEEAGSIGIKLDECSRSIVEKCRLHNNATYGIEDEGGSYTIIRDNLVYDNGRPAGGDNTSGRGVVLWKTVYGLVAGNRVYDNTEYGIRIYSEAGDASAASYNLIAGNTLRDNGDAGTTAIELYEYNEHGSITGNSWIDNVVIKTTSRGQLMSVQGIRTRACGNTLVAADGDNSIPAILLYGCSNADIKNNHVVGVSNGIQFSSSAPPSSCVIESNTGVDVTSIVATSYGTGHLIQNNSDEGALAASGAGPYAVGIAAQNYIQWRQGGTFTSGGASTRAAALGLHTDLVGATGDTLSLALIEAGESYGGSITTQTAAETVAVIATILLSEPGITKNVSTITRAATLYVINAPTEGTDNYAIFVNAGKTALAATTADDASLSLPHGTAPSSPVNGDIWTTTAGVFVHVNGTTYQLDMT